MTEGQSLKTDSRAPLIRTASTQYIKPRELKLVPAWSLHLYILVTLAWEATLKVTERETTIFSVVLISNIQYILFSEKNMKFH